MACTIQVLATTFSGPFGLQKQLSRKIMYCVTCHSLVARGDKLRHRVGVARGVCVRMLMLAASAVLRASPGGFGRLCRFASSRAMGDPAAGKKAAAVKAVNEWVKVCNMQAHH